MATKEMKRFTREEVAQVRPLFSRLLRSTTQSSHSIPVPAQHRGEFGTSPNAVRFPAYQTLNAPAIQWIVIDARVYDVTRFRNLHPGGASVFLDEGVRECLVFTPRA